MNETSKHFQSDEAWRKKLEGTNSEKLTGTVEHTPTPWKIDQSGSVIAGGKTLVVSGVSMVMGKSEQAEANARFIITACNSHASLLASNKELRELLGKLAASRSKFERLRATSVRSKVQEAEQELDELTYEALRLVKSGEGE